MDCIETSLSSIKTSFDTAYDIVGKFLDHHPLLYKITLVASHIFRAMMISTYMLAFPVSPLITWSALVIPTLLYRAAIERFCPFRFSIPSLLGGAAFWLTYTDRISAATQGIFYSPATSIFAGACLGAYLVTICYLSHSDVEGRMHKITGRPYCCQ